MAEEKKKMQLKIVIDEKTAGGAYSNGAVINYSETEFLLDFIMLQPQAPQAKVVSRLILNPVHAKRFLKALAENLAGYEKQHGEIKLPSAPDAGVKFMQ